MTLFDGSHVEPVDAFGQTPDERYWARRLLTERIVWRRIRKLIKRAVADHNRFQGLPKMDPRRVAMESRNVAREIKYQRLLRLAKALARQSNRHPGHPGYSR